METKNFIATIKCLPPFKNDGRLNRNVINVFYSGGKRYSPIFMTYLDKTPCDPQVLIDKSCYIKFEIKKDRKGLERIYIHLLGDSEKKCGQSVRMILADEKDVGAGAYIRYDWGKALFTTKFSSRGGTHWEVFAIVPNEPVQGVRRTATANKHNTYAITA